MLLINKHNFIIGTTQSGKTELAKARAEAFKGGVFFFNPQAVEMPKSFSTVDCNYSIEQMIQCLKSGFKINYIPHHNDKIALKELNYIAEKVFYDKVQRKDDKPLSFVVDECHMYIKNNTESPVLNIATRGLRFGLYLTTITQRPALTNNTLFTQAEWKTYLHVEGEEWKYLKGQGIPIKEIQKQLTVNGMYSYIDKYVTLKDNPILEEYSKPHIEKLAI